MWVLVIVLGLPPVPTLMTEISNFNLLPIKMDLRGIRWSDMDCTYLVRQWDLRMALVNTGMNLRVS
jgi:hypothetical protein